MPAVDKAFDAVIGSRASPLWVLMGASGRVGRMLMRHWRTLPPKGFCILPQMRGLGQGLNWAPLEAAKPLVDLAEVSGGIAGLIVLSGITPGPGADLTCNSALVQAAVDAAQLAGVPRLLVASSSAVYGAGAGFPQAETAPTKPVNAYGEAKLAVEAICNQARQVGLNVSALRIGNVAGADALLLNAALSTLAVPLRLDCFPNGAGPMRSYIGPATLAAVLETLARNTGSLPACLNIGAPAPVSMESLATAAGAHWQYVPAPPTAFQNITLDCTRLAALHSFSSDAHNPAAMVAEWLRLKDPA